MMKVKIEIGKLVLDGTDRKDATYVGRVVESELARMIETGGMPKGEIRDIELKSVDAGSVSIHKGQSATSLGSSLARSIYDSLGETK
jgi:hypothetical protein